MTRERVLTGRPLETTLGFCRAIRVGNRIDVTGTAPTNPDGSTAGGDNPYRQAKACLHIIEDAIHRLGGSLPDIYRTRVYLVDVEDAEAVGLAHGEAFGETKPVTTFVVVKALLNPEWLVEIEAYAEIDDT